MTKKLKALEVEMYPERYAECVYIPNPVAKRAFPPEAYTWDDDVEPEVVDSLRERASRALSTWLRTTK